ncbi:hypothetical protein [Bacillus thuringiensis]|uniref:hypothetical protein n=1 Tax=Bacillus thuringiensis TaxID=1428 RepID=UPI000BEB8651|nr:hypothetical protein [Bacillus thuringiensis]PDZ92540.1 hypothetical protein CON47_06150 [Bacillus thuringiensis]
MNVPKIVTEYNTVVANFAEELEFLELDPAEGGNVGSRVNQIALNYNKDVSTVISDIRSWF